MSTPRTDANIIKGHPYRGMDHFARQLERELNEVTAALDAAGCPIGNEHKQYDQVERIAGLNKTKDYAWREMDKLRAENAELLTALKLLYEETADYITVNKLGDVHHNRSMQMARDALPENARKK